MMKEMNEYNDDITIGLESMEQEVRPKLHIGHMIPDFRLSTTDEQMISLVDFKEKKNLVILFFNPRSNCDWETLSLMKRRYLEITEENAEVLGIAAGPMVELKDCVSTLGLPFPLLNDNRMEAACKFCATESIVFVADKYGELKYQGSMCGNVDENLDKVISVLDGIELECPECGVSTWPEFG